MEIDEKQLEYGSKTSPLQGGLRANILACL